MGKVLAIINMPTKGHTGIEKKQVLLKSLLKPLALKELDVSVDDLIIIDSYNDLYEGKHKLRKDLL